MKGMLVKNEVWRPSCFTQDEWVEWKKMDEVLRIADGSRSRMTKPSSICVDCMGWFQEVMIEKGLCDAVEIKRRKINAAARKRHHLLWGKRDRA